ncbi:MAG: glycine cleavage system aminomethyltransferase GcvT [Arenicella sp.]|jgi:aminomethyltransferase|nr:glycine cleavage system aminomethyltransferase GcvT [Arenicella sp.]
MTTPKQTPLYQQHIDAGGKIVDFGGWALPVNYGSQIEEHVAVRTACGMFDVSHMTVSDVNGANARAFLQKLLANDVSKTDDVAGKAIYSCMLNKDAGVIDDLIVYHLTPQHYRIISNAGTRDKVIPWLIEVAAEFDVVISERPEMALLAVQGPNAFEVLSKFMPSDDLEKISSLKRFQAAQTPRAFVGRTGYTGEDGYELISTAADIVSLWQDLLTNGVQPCGLGARDTLRLEAGMALYGNDLDEEHTPYESGLKWSVDTRSERNFIGRATLQNTPPKWQSIGLILEDKGVLRSHQTLHIDEQSVGEITSGSYSPSLERSIAMARVNADLDPSKLGRLTVAVRNKFLSVSITKPPFLKKG